MSHVASPPFVGSSSHSQVCAPHRSFSLPTGVRSNRCEGKRNLHPDEPYLSSTRQPLLQLEVTAVTIQPRRKTYLPGASPLPWHEESSSPTGNIMLRFRSPLAARATVLTSSTVGRLCSQTQGTCSANY